MNRIATLSIIPALFLALPLQATEKQQPQASSVKSIAVTIDDLPGWEPVNERVAEQTLKALAASLNQAKAPATGFVIGQLGSRHKDAQRALEAWAKAGLPLGNHSWDHKDYNKADPQDFWEGVKRTETVIAPLRTKYGPWPLAFRFPMLHQGKSAEKEKLANQYLESTGTLLAYVSIDNSDWAFAQYYDKARKKKNGAELKRIETLYLEHILDCVSYAEDASDHVFGRQIPQILLLHSNALNAAKLGSILEELTEHGYRFITLTEALDDPAYAPYKHKIADQPVGEHFFAQMAHILARKLPNGPDRMFYRYFTSHWEPKLK